MGRLALVLHYLVSGRLVLPFQQPVQSPSSDCFIGSRAHPEMPTVPGWLMDVAGRFRQQRDRFVASAGVVAVWRPHRAQSRCPTLQPSR